MSESQDERKVVMISWMGMIFSALSFAFQLKDNLNEKAYSSKIIEISKQAVDKLSFIKDIHGFYQEIYYQDYEKYFKSFGKNNNMDERLWKTNTKKREQDYKRYNLDVTLPAEINKKSVTYTRDDIDEVNKIITSIGVERNINILNKAYPSLLGDISKLDELLNKYNQHLNDTGGFLPKTHQKMDKLFTDILFDADRCLKELIEVLYRIMQNV